MDRRTRLNLAPGSNLHMLHRKIITQLTDAHRRPREKGYGGQT
jgi:hypothetical protein